ncbi:hypothetical protein B0H10DRAFT_2072493, partial [Mycena sp. CBHHK59/15]
TTDSNPTPTMDPMEHRSTDFMSVCPLWARLHVEPAQLHVSALACSFFFVSHGLFS